MAEVGKEEDPGYVKDSPFVKFIDANVKRSPYFYYNMGAFVVLYNRIKADLMNKKPGGGSTAFDTEIFEIIKDGMSGTKAEIDAFLDKFNVKGIISTYDMTDADEAKKADSDQNSSYNFMKQYDNLVSHARDLARLKYKGKEHQMLSNDDVREILRIKEYRADRPYERIRMLVDNQEIDSKGGSKDGPYLEAFKHAKQKLKNFKKKRRLEGWKAAGHGIGILGSVAGIVGSGFLAFSPWGLAAYGAARSASLVAKIVLGVAGGAGGFGGIKLFAQNFAKKIGAWFGANKKLREFKNSTGEYGDADEKDLSKIGYARIKKRYYETVARRYFIENYGKEKIFRNGRELKKDNYSAKQWKQIIKNAQPWEFVQQPELRKAFKQYLKDQAELPNGKTVSRMFQDAKYHRYTSERTLNQDSKEFGFYKLHAFMNEGVEGYETSSLSADELIMNYSDDEPHNRLYQDRIKEHKGYDSELDYLIGQLNEFVAQEKAFTDAHLESGYKKRLELFAEKFDNSFNTTLFENAYSQTLINGADDALESESVKTMIKAANRQTNEKKMKGVLAFLKKEKDNTSRNQLSEDVGVGVEYQMDMSADSIVAGCRTLGDESPDTVAIANSIGNMTGRSDYAAISTTIDALPESNPSKKYLKHMLRVKNDQTVNNTNTSFGDTVSVGGKFIHERINELDSTGAKAKHIREDIIANVPAAKRNDALKALDEQVKILEVKRRDDARVRAIKGVKKGSTKVEDLLKQISELKSFEVTDIGQLWIDIGKVDRPELVEYLQLRFKDKITQNLKFYATTSTNFAGEDGAAQIKKVSEFLYKLQSCINNKYIDEWQRQAIMDALGDQINSIFRVYLQDLERTFLTDTEKKKTNLINYVTQPPPNGLKDYFDSRTPESEQILQKAMRFIDSANVLSFMTVNSIGGYDGLIDADSADSRAALQIYFGQDRNTSDPLLLQLARLNSDVQHTNIISNDPDIISAVPTIIGTETVNIDGQMISFPKFESPSSGNYNCKRIINKGGSYDLPVPAGQMTGSYIYSTINTLRSTEFMNCSPVEKLAALAILKKKIAGMMRVQMIRLYAKKRGGATNYPDFVMNNRDDLDNNLITNWLVLANLVDTLIVNAKNGLTPDEKIAYNNVTNNTVDAVNAICNIDDYGNKVKETKVFGA